MKDIELMEELEKSLLAFLNKNKKHNRFFVFKLDVERPECFLGYAYPMWNPRMGDEHDKIYMCVDKQKFRAWKINQILKKLD